MSKICHRELRKIKGVRIIDGEFWIADFAQQDRSLNLIRPHAVAQCEVRHKFG